MWTLNFFLGVFLVFLGLVIRIFKMSFLIAGYNTASEKKREKYNEDVLIKYVGNFICILGGILAAGGILSLLLDSSKTVINNSWIVFSVAVVGGLFYLNLTPKVRK